MTVPVGAFLGPYRVVAMIGQGGMGEVYRAHDSRLGRDVAIKFSKEQFTERFEREARAVAALNHPNICHLYDVGPNYLVMEFIEGAPLKGPLPVEKAVAFGGQILDALDAAHKKGIVHRDLKPANILVTKQGIKLLDFGLAKQSGALRDEELTGVSALTGAGQILGTLQYMSPEQLQGKEADARSDLFAFGCVLYEMLSGRQAFTGSSPASIIAAILEREPAPLDTAPPLDRIIATCLAKDPDQRFQNARDLKRDLAWAVEEQPLREAENSRRSLWFGAAAIAVIAGLSVAAFMHFRQPGPGEERTIQLALPPPEGGRFVSGGRAIGGLTLSPDGRYAAFVANVSGKTALWLRPLDSASAIVMPGTDGATMPFWSPDSRSLGFVAGGKLQRIDIGGQAPQVVCEAPSVVLGGMWTTDGMIVFSPNASNLWRVPASGGVPAPFTRLDPKLNEDAHVWPHMLPGGKFLYWARSVKPENQAIYAASLDNPADRVRVMTSGSSAFYSPPAPSYRKRNGYLLWIRGSALMAQEFDAGALRLRGEPEPVVDPVSFIPGVGRPAASVSDTGLLATDSTVLATQPIWFDRTGKSLGNAAAAAPSDQVSLSPDSRRAIFVVSKSSGFDLWLREWERGVSTRLTFTAGLNQSPVWSPDGLSLVFSAGQPLNLYRMRVGDSASAVRLTQSLNPQDVTDWSRNGQFALYNERSRETQLDLWILPLTEPNSKPRPYLRTPFNETNARFSAEANPHWVAYQSDETGRNEVYILAFPEPRAKVQISAGGGAFPQWGPGGRELYYLAPDNNLMVVSLKPGADSIVPSAPSVLFALPPLSPIFFGAPYLADSTGQRFLVAAAPPDKSASINLIVNWQSLLKQGATSR